MKANKKYRVINTNLKLKQQIQVASWKRRTRRSSGVFATTDEAILIEISIKIRNRWNVNKQDKNRSDNKPPNFKPPGGVSTILMIISGIVHISPVSNFYTNLN